MSVEANYQFHDPASLIRGELCRRFCGCQNLSERYGAEKKLCASRNKTVIVRANRILA